MEYFIFESRLNAVPGRKSPELLEPIIRGIKMLEILACKRISGVIGTMLCCGLFELEMGKQLKQLRENARKSGQALGRDYPFGNSEE